MAINDSTEATASNPESTGKDYLMEEIRTALESMNDTELEFFLSLLKEIKDHESKGCTSEEIKIKCQFMVEEFIASQGAAEQSEQLAA